LTRFLLPKDYIRYKLTGVFASEVSDASGTQFLDVPKRRWSEELLNKLGFSLDWMPEVYESHEISGTISAEAAELNRLKQGTPVAGGGGDQAAGAVGNGIIQPGVISSTIGTSGVVFASMDQVRWIPWAELRPSAMLFPNTWHVMGVTQAAGLSLQWLRTNFGGMERELAVFMGIDPYVLMDKEAERAKPGCDGLIYLPYLMGERAPHLDPYARGVFFGLTAKHGRCDMIQICYGRSCYSLRDCWRLSGICRCQSRKFVHLVAAAEVRCGGKCRPMFSKLLLRL
jgi:xylulokinase